MQMAAIVPTITIMNAAAETNAMRPAPLRTAPTRPAFSASTSPTMLRMSKASPLFLLQRPRRVPWDLHAEAGQQRVHVGLAGSHFPLRDARHDRAGLLGRFRTDRQMLDVAAGELGQIGES